MTFSGAKEKYSESNATDSTFLSAKSITERHKGKPQQQLESVTLFTTAMICQNISIVFPQTCSTCGATPTVAEGKIAFCCLPRKLWLSTYANCFLLIACVWETYIHAHKRAKKCLLTQRTAAMVHFRWGQYRRKHWTVIHIPASSKLPTAFLFYTRGHLFEACHTQPFPPPPFNFYPDKRTHPSPPSNPSRTHTHTNTHTHLSTEAASILAMTYRADKSLATHPL